MAYPLAQEAVSWAPAETKVLAVAQFAGWVQVQSVLGIICWIS